LGGDTDIDGKLLLCDPLFLSQSADGGGYIQFHYHNPLSTKSISLEPIPLDSKVPLYPVYHNSFPKAMTGFATV
jgi:hypothetical protein